ncbi:unnamed protein product [Brassicogethes aeneus]|uniref:FYVE-type domain-containing protein n=1 Tax=Brassicogethes aeneus TaxID=1431903 RepID=A0A9P0FEL3_BRAAE|nr:unnamed protein product [Brassicogethes aeneus]
MSCNHCSTKFNFFHKEMGCSHCGLSFCNKCLKQKCKIPSKGNGEYNVCRICFNKLTTGNSANQSTSQPPPDTFLKRLENLENPSAPPITIYKQNHDQRGQNLRAGLSQVDQKLVERLEKLKEDKGPPPPSEIEIRKRLANLRGENDYVEGPSRQPLFTNDTRSEQQRVDSLLDQFVNEREIELAYNPQEEIEARLATLREKGVRPNEGPYIANLHDSGSSEEELDKITKKIMDEVALEQRCSLPTENKTKPQPIRSKAASNSSTEDDESGGRSASAELPWCVLCNNDARYRCYDCSGDLYCNECHKEVHKNWGDSDHKVVPYKNK